MERYAAVSLLHVLFFFYFISPSAHLPPPPRFQPSLPVAEEDGFISLPVQRARGTFGVAQVAYRVEPADESVFLSSMGTLTFPPGVSEQNINLLLLDDDEPEVARNFTVILSQLTPSAARLGAATLTLLLAESEFPYGLFSLANTAVVARELDVPSPAAVTVERNFGRSGRVSVSWSVVSCETCALGAPCEPCRDGTIEAQLAPSQGVLTFEDGQRNASIVVSVLPDTVPEVEMRFTFALSSASPASIADNSGAPENHALVIPTNDDAYGAFEILVASAVATDGSRRSARIFETANARVPLEVHRRGGTRGAVTVAWRVVHLSTATPAEQQPVPDVLAANGTLSFAAGVAFGALTIPIGNDNVPEVDELFAVELYNPTGGASVATPNVSITIVENDDARGVIEFVSSAVLSAASEASGVAHLRLERLRGTFGRVAVRWAVTSGDPNGDLLALNGTAIFEEGEAAANLSIPLRNDMEPETAESFVVQLQGAQDGARLGSRITAVLTIRGSDDPHGVFQFSEPVYSVAEPEGGTSIAVVEVERIGGALGDVAVRVELDLAQGDNIAAAGSDFGLPSSTLVLEFAPGQRTASFNVTLLPDDMPEDTEDIVFVLTDATLEVDNGPYEGPSPRLGAISTTAVRIAENDDARGVFALERQASSVMEGSRIPVRIVRRRGLFKRVSVAVTIAAPAAPACAQVSLCAASSDFNATSVTLVFEEGQDEQRLPVVVADDTDPELAGAFVVEIVSAEGARIDDAASAVALTIEASDDPHGIFAFSEADVAAAASAAPIVEPPLGSRRVAWTVVRTQGAFGTVAVSWTLERTAAAGVYQIDPLRDVVARTGAVTFLEGQREAQVVIFVLADDVGELEEAFRVRLSGIASGSGRLSSSPDDALSISATIAANDDPFGVFRIAEAGTTVDIAEGQVTPGEATISVVRERSALGTVDVTLAVLSPVLPSLADRQLAYSFDSLDDLILLQLFEGPVQGAVLNVPVEVVLNVDSALECMSLCLAAGEAQCASVSVWPGEECLLHAGTRSSPNATFVSR